MGTEKRRRREQWPPPTTGTTWPLVSTRWSCSALKRCSLWVINHKHEGATSNKQSPTFHHKYHQGSDNNWFHQRKHPHPVLVDIRSLSWSASENKFIPFGFVKRGGLESQCWYALNQLHLQLDYVHWQFTSDPWNEIQLLNDLMSECIWPFSRVCWWRFTVSFVFVNRG